MSAIKSTIKKILVSNEEKRYQKTVKSKYVDYNSWILSEEKKIFDQKIEFEQKNNCQIIDTTRQLCERFENDNDRELAEYIKLCKLYEVKHADNCAQSDAQYLVAEGQEMGKVLKILQKMDNKQTNVILKLFFGEISDFSIFLIHKYFFENKNQIMIYPDEDRKLSDGKRVDPWFKPDWAPDDFLSLFYFGSLLAIRGDIISNYSKLNTNNIYNYLYELLLLNGAFDKHSYFSSVDKSVVGHIPYVLFHSIDEGGYSHARKLKLSVEIREKKDDDTISVIIPSKDHPDILFRCIDSFLDITRCDGIKYEFIIVDNGSSDANRSVIENLIKDYNKSHLDVGFNYIYEEKVFNFSYMCNLGARNSKGKFLLFLNDDMEIIEADWLNKLYQKALLPYAGAVGAKLLYPPSIKKGGNIIQHAGITNLKIGPAHKLQFEDDTIDHYYGRNRYCHDMIGVTGACLLVRRDIFDEVGGFDENLAVAFNDVDLCFKIFEHGYYNIERNDVRLYHHESLSRGNDADSSEKMLRLAREKDYLYEKHQAIYGKDPFYNINLTTDMLETEYAPKYHYEVKLDTEWSKVSDVTELINSAREDKCVRVGMECAMDIYKWKYGVPVSKGSIEPGPMDSGFYFQGYTFVIGSNNACYDRLLLFKNLETMRVYGIEVSKDLRPDIKNNLADQINVDLTGYTGKIKEGSVPKGNYQFGMYMKDRTSSQRLYNWSNWTLEV